MLRLALLVVATWVAGVVGFATYASSIHAAVLWPMTGVALLWAATGDRRTWPLDAVAFSAVNVAAPLTSEATPGQAVMGGVQALVQVVVYLVVVRRLAPDLWSARGTRPLVRPADLGAFTVAVVVAALVATAVRALGLGLIPPASGAEAALVWVRNIGGMFTIGVVALLVVPLLRSGRRPADVRAAAREWWGRWPARTPEAVAVVVVSTIIYALAFVQRDPLPVSFLLMLPVLWTGLRMSPLLAAGLSLVLGTIGLLLTLDGRGVFAAVPDLRAGTLLAQGFVIASLGFSVAIALVSSERLRATERAVRSERQAADRAATLSAVVEKIPESIVVVRADGVVTLANAGVRTPPGSPVHNDVGLSLAHPDIHDAAGRLLPPEALPHARVLAGQEIDGERVTVLGPDGTRTLEIHGSPLPSHDPDALPEALVVMRDVTEERRREDDLAAFAGVVAHDLRSPLTVLGGWADALGDAFAEGPVDAATGLAMTGRIQDAATHMRHFIGDLLAFTVARDRALDAAAVDLSALAEEVAALRRESPRRPEIAVQPGLRATGDAVLLRQLLDNLLGNAVKYVDPERRPRIEVTGRTVGTDLEVAVSDNGVGVPERDRERIFDTFARAHAGSFTGTGLGLAICRQVVERHGGTIHVEDGTDGGSRFVLRLPSAGPAAPNP